MSKRIFALLLCAVMLVPVLSACSSLGEDDPGAYITMYMSDEIYDFDPAKAYYNTGTANVVSMMFETLFKLDENGKIVNALAKDYKIIEENGEYAMQIELNQTKWSNGLALTAEDVVYAWRRLLNQENSYEAASLLFDIKNARAVKEGDEAPDDLGVEALEPTVLKITFEGKPDYNQFLLNLTSVVTAPLSESVVAKNADWAKKSSTMITSGPFKLGKIKYIETTDPKVKDDNAINKSGEAGSSTSPVMRLEYFYLERNRHYYRNDERDALDKSVVPYRILVDCSMSDAELLQAYKDGKIFYMTDIPLALRTDEYVQNNVKLSNALSTTICYLNQDVAPLNVREVRQALSLVIDRDAIAQKVVYAEGATALVPPHLVNTTPGKNVVKFRDEGGALISTAKNLDEAKNVLAKAKIDGKAIVPSKYSFTIKYAAYDEVHTEIAKMIAAAWCELGFKVKAEPVYAIQNNDYLKTQEEVPKDVCDDLFIETIERRKFDVVLFDYTAYSADAFSMLGNFATAFSGMALNRKALENGQLSYSLTPNRTGYNSTAYNNIMEAIYYLPYFASLDRNNANQKFAGSLYTNEDFAKVYDTVKSVYDKYWITPTTDEKQWVDQRARLLHEAEKILMNDMPVIPVIFNKTAVMVSGELKDISATYYCPYNFQKTQLKDYNSYTYTESEVDATGATVKKVVSIFDSFPEVAWDKKGQ